MLRKKNMANVKFPEFKLYSKDIVVKTHNIEINAGTRKTF